MREAGFTLVEMLVVLAVIGLVAGLVAPQIMRYLGTARVDTTNAQIRNIVSALDLYFIDNGGYPSQEQGLSALAIAPADATRWNGPYLKGADKLADPGDTPTSMPLTKPAFLFRRWGETANGWRWARQRPYQLIAITLASWR
jgi:general secretion pathway protein G